MPAEEIPEYPAFRKISISDKAAIDPLFGLYPAEVSERTFASVFVWRNYGSRSRLSMLDGHLLISWRREQIGDLLLPPVGQDPARISADLASMRPAGFNGVFCLTEPAVSGLKDRGYAPEPLRDEWDYVYRTKDLIGLEGPKYHTQRKELNKATSQHELSFERMTEEHREASLRLEVEWCNLKACTFDKLSTAEDAALKEALENMDELGLLGGVAIINGKVEALTIGERLNSSTAVVHFEKADPRIRGLYQFINQQFCEKVLKDYEFVNREQDVGEPGLRRAKEGYHPHHFVEKHLLRF